MSEGLTGLVLAGGGMRGAYEAGVVCGIIEVLGLGEDDEPPFQIFAGNSVGAINVAFLAAHGHRGDLHAGELCRIYESLRIERDLKPDPLGLLAWKPPGILSRGRNRSKRLGRSLLNPVPFEKIIRDGIPWARLRDNVDAGRVKALVVAALEVATGRTTIFAELADGMSFRASRDPRRHAVLEPIGHDHVLASAAIPVLFPARLINDAHYVDGGLRFNTPLSPALRLGADRIVVVSLTPRSEVTTGVSEPGEDLESSYPSIAFLLGKLLNALLLDPIVYDLQVLERFNRLFEILERALPADELERVEEILLESRGARIRKVEPLVFLPTEDPGTMAGDYIRQHLKKRRLGFFQSRLLDFVVHSPMGREADLASYLLFDGGYARDLIELGKRDVHARADEVRAFFQ